jgi:hypothetical protein
MFGQKKRYWRVLDGAYVLDTLCAISGPAGIFMFFYLCIRMILYFPFVFYFISPSGWVRVGLFFCSLWFS